MAYCVTYMYVILIPFMNNSTGVVVTACPVSMAGVEWREGEVGCNVVNMINC